MVLHLSFPKMDIFVPLNKTVVVNNAPNSENDCIYINSTEIYCPKENKAKLKEVISAYVKKCYDTNESITVEIDRDTDIGKLVYEWGYFYEV